MNNWYPHENNSHPNFTGFAKRTFDGELYSPKHDPAPAKWQQAGIGILAAVALILWCWL